MRPYLVSPDVKRAQGHIVCSREVENLVACESLEEVVCELEHGVGDDVVDDVLLVRVGVRVWNAYWIWKYGCSTFRFHQNVLHFDEIEVYCNSISSKDFMSQDLVNPNVLHYYVTHYA